MQNAETASYLHKQAATDHQEAAIKTPQSSRMPRHEQLVRCRRHLKEHNRMLQ